MIDTIKLILIDGTFEVKDNTKFKPNADVVLHPFLTDAVVKAVQNPTKAETMDKIYKPRLTLLRQFKKVSLTIEFSIPKLMFGNNFEEIGGADLKFVIKTLQRVLLEMGIGVEEEYLKSAKVQQVDYGKNFILTGISTAVTLINLIAKADTTFRTDISTKFYRNGGKLVSFYTKIQEIVFYDKIKDLQKELNISKKRTKEVDAELQREFLANYGKHDVLRMEVRIRHPKKLKRAIQREMGSAISTTLARITSSEEEVLQFRHVFDDDIAKKILTNYLMQLKKMLYTVMASYKDGMLQYFISEGIKPQKALAYAKALELIKEQGERSFRVMFPSVHKQIDKLKQHPIIGVILNTDNHNSIFLSNAFQRLEDVLYHFRPIRLENGKNIQGMAEITNRDFYEFLPTKEDKKYQDMVLNIKPKDKNEKNEEEAELVDFFGVEDDDNII